jgi:hypothetical protein
VGDSEAPQPAVAGEAEVVHLRPSRSRHVRVAQEVVARAQAIAERQIAHQQVPDDELAIRSLEAVDARLGVLAHQHEGACVPLHAIAIGRAEEARPEREVVEHEAAEVGDEGLEAGSQRRVVEARRERDEPQLGRCLLQPELRVALARGRFEALG